MLRVRLRVIRLILVCWREVKRAKMSSVLLLLIGGLTRSEIRRTRHGRLRGNFGRRGPFDWWVAIERVVRLCPDGLGLHGRGRGLVGEGRDRKCWRAGFRG